MNRSNIIRKTFLLALCMHLIGQICAQTNNANITKDEIISKSWKAMFGNLKSSDIKSIYIEAYYHGREIPSRVTINRPNLFRNEIRSGVLVFDGKRAAEIEKKPNEKGNPQNPEILEPYHWMHFDVDIALYFPAFFDYPSEYKGISQKGEKETYEIYVELPLGANITYFIDVESFLITRRIASYSGKPDDLWENVITDYIDYNGIIYPDGFTYEGQDGIEKGIYKNVKFNIKPDDNLFEIPKELLNEVLI